MSGIEPAILLSFAVLEPIEGGSDIVIGKKSRPRLKPMGFMAAIVAVFFLLFYCLAAFAAQRACQIPDSFSASGTDLLLSQRQNLIADSASSGIQ